VFLLLFLGVLDLRWIISPDSRFCVFWRFQGYERCLVNKNTNSLLNYIVCMKIRVFLQQTRPQESLGDINKYQVHWRDVMNRNGWRHLLIWICRKSKLQPPRLTSEGVESCLVAADWYPASGSFSSGGKELLAGSSDSRQLREIKRHQVHWRDVMNRNGWRHLLIWICRKSKLQPPTI
jgi:hypothetical protein